MDDKTLKDMCIGSVVVLSGVRLAGRIVDNRKVGRSIHGLLYIWSGETKFWENGKHTVTVGDGELLFIPKNAKYKMQYSKNNTTFVLVNFNMFDSEGYDLALFDRITVVGKDDETRRIASVMAKLEITGASEGPAAYFRRKELVYRLLSRIFEDNFPLFTGQQRYPQIFKGVLLLKQSYLENIPITKLAEACNISVSSFRELFKKQYGMSPLQYRNRLRINRAKELLSEGGCTVAEAAFASGFENIGYFCNCYKKITGETPSKAKISEQ